jgi:pyruvate dehydrogenase E1 component alpha subunit/2-oxoisovalerate dehydrogenase E1 component alpha subunit
MNALASVEPLSYTSQEVEGRMGRSWKETLWTAYRWMVLARAFDARMQALQRQGRIGFYAAATGQEAVNVAAGLVSTPDDWVFPGLREQLVALVRGFSLTAYAHSIFADDEDVARGRQMPCHPTAREVHYVSMSSVIGTQISQAVGLAYALRLRSEPGVVLAFFGDGATSSNDFHAGLNFAGVFRLPVLFVCANNQWAISVPVSRQTAVPTMAAKAAAYGISGQRVDGTDFVAVYHALHEALGTVRSGSGPTLVEFLTYRMTPHSSSDDPSRYQPPDWSARAGRLDPVLRLESWMRSEELLTDANESAIRAEAEERVRDAVRAAEAAPPPAPESLTEDLYASERSPSRDSAS